MADDQNQTPQANQKPPDEGPPDLTQARRFSSEDVRDVRILEMPKILLDQTARTGATEPLLYMIKNRTEAIGFKKYDAFIHALFCTDDRLSRRACGGQEYDANHPEQDLRDDGKRLPKPLHGLDAYQLLKAATELFLLRECGARIEPEQGTDTHVEMIRLLRERFSNNVPFLERFRTQIENQIVKEPFCFDLLKSRIDCPCMLELIWSYWHEEGMLVQTITAVARRFQNRRGDVERDPLATMEIGYLRPLSNLLWGYIQDESNRLSLARRAYEYDHHYGLTIYGKAVPSLRAADSRSKFLAAFHNLLFRTSEFYKQAANLLVVPDTFPLLEALKEVHLLLADGMHNQYGDLPWTARAEMLIQQWLLSRPELRDFLRGREMAPYAEPWMPAVDAMKLLQSWGDVSVRHFRDLAVHGEQLLLSIRFVDWSVISDAIEARGWAESLRAEVQGYLHAYRAVTGVDLSVVKHGESAPDATPPWVHLRNRRQQLASGA